MGRASATPFLFNGKFGVMTDENGLYYMRARFYSAAMKRFVNMDVLLGNIAEGQSLNRFAFVTGRPVSLVDPFGLAQKDVNRAIDIMKVFLPCIYNNKATVIIGNPFKWWNPRHWWIVLTGGSIDGYTIDDSITIDEQKFGKDIYPYMRIPIFDHEGTIVGYRYEKLNQIAVETLSGLLEVLIHEYQHVNNPVGSHAHIYATSKLLGDMLTKYMLLKDEEWEEVKEKCTEISNCNTLESFSSICSSLHQRCVQTR